MDLKEIAEQIRVETSKIVLIYAFNAVGKTRLSVAYKETTKQHNGGYHAGVYFNAYSEDLFFWDNDEEHSNQNMKLSVLESSLNQYHSYLIEGTEKLEDGRIVFTRIQEKLNRYNPNFTFKINVYQTNGFDDIEKGIDSFSFYTLDDVEQAHPIKISRGEERIFIWCFFLALFEVEAWIEEQDAHIFIDDPVSSLDEHNIHITASAIMDVIENNYKKKKIIITTHHVELFSILIDRLRKASGSERFKNITKTFILGKDPNGKLLLSSYGNDVFLYHLHLYKMIKENIDTTQTGYLDCFNFVLLRQLLENIASFLGRSGNFGFALSRIGFDDPNVANIVNEQSHKDVYYYQTHLMSPEQQKLFIDILGKIETIFQFQI